MRTTQVGVYLRKPHEGGENFTETLVSPMGEGPGQESQWASLPSPLALSKSLARRQMRGPY